MAIRLKQSTASQEVPLGPFLDDTDGKTAETALTIANTDIKVWKNGATTLANKNSGGATHISGGIYYAVLDATDTNTLGPLVIFVQVAGALPVRVECEVLAANVFDSLVGGGDTLDVQVTGIGADVVNASALAADAVTEIQSGLATAASQTTIAGYIDTEVAAILAAVDTEVAAIKAKTDNLPASPAATGDIPSAATIADAVWDEAIADHIGAGAAGLSLINAENYAANVSLNFDLLQGTLMLEWGTLTGATSTTANTGGLLADDAPVGALLVITGGTGVGQVRRITDYVSATGVATVSPAWTITPDSTSDYSILADADSSAGSLTAAAIADAVWDELVADHTDVGSTGEALGAAGGGVTAAAIADAVWDEALSGHVTAGSAGKALGDIDTDTSAILVDTGTDIPASITALNDLDAAGVRAAVGLAAANLDTQLAAIDDAVDTEVASILAAVDTEVAAIKAKTDLLPASPAATGDIPTATQNADALLTRDMSAVTGEAARSPLNALRALRNKTARVGSTLTVYEEDDATAAWTADVTTAAGDPITGVDPA